MQPTRNFFSTFFMTLGFILVLLIAGVLYLIIVDPFDFKPMLFETAQVRTPDMPEGREGVIQGEVVVASPSSGDEFIFSEAQKEAIRGYGIDPGTVPTSVTPLELLCFEEKLGTSRVSEIRGGAVPTTFEFFRVKSCIGS
jgi:hypothetical protein